LYVADDDFVGLVVSHGQNMDEHAACGFSSTLQPDGTENVSA
jgi:hypothetical protein